MAQDYTEYLAVNVLNEQQYVSYRNLSRALKVHSNLAKQMLYDFHHKQNSRKPGSVHATYLVTGTKRVSSQTNGTLGDNDDEDSIMQSSPPIPSSSMPQDDDDDDGTEEAVTVKTMMLVKEESLDKARAQFEDISGMHIYSLEASSPKDIHVLTECNRRVAAEYALEDPLKEWKQYGTIQNPSVKRRSGKRAPPPPAAPAPKPQVAKAKAAAAAAAKSSAAEVNSATKPPDKNASTEQSNSLTTKATAAKKQDTSIFKSFAKGAAKPKKTDSQQDSVAASPASAALPEDVPMTGFSDDELDEDGGSGLPEEETSDKVPAGKSKKDREAELQAMMDKEDEPMEDAGTPAEETENHDEGAIDAAESQDKAEPTETMTVENGRRRGRRRVMKKKTVKDEEGYLVTKEEAAWESFSEEEPEPKKARIQPSAAKPAAGKKGGKPGQGNIMSFFAKK